MNETARYAVMSGNEACAEGALIAGLQFFAGYPITPSTEIAERLAEELPRRGGVFLQLEDEIAAMGAVIGASLCGRKVMTATSGPGFSLKQENLGYGQVVEAPAVVVNVMRGGPSTGLPTHTAQGDVMQARWGSHGDRPVIALVPYSVRETLDLTVRAFNLAERFRTPVILLLDEVVGHVNEKIRLPEPGEFAIVDRLAATGPPETFEPYAPGPQDVPPMAPFGSAYRHHVTGLLHDASGFPSNDTEVTERLVRRLQSKIEGYRAEVDDVQSEAADDAELGVIAYGSTARSVRRAIQLARAAGLPLGMLRPRTLWPFPEAQVRAFAARVRRLLVVEANLGQIVGEVRAAAAGTTPIDFLGRVNGEPISPNEILAWAREQRA